MFEAFVQTSLFKKNNFKQFFSISLMKIWIQYINKKKRQTPISENSEYFFTVINKTNTIASKIRLREKNLSSVFSLAVYYVKNFKLESAKKN